MPQDHSIERYVLKYVLRVLGILLLLALAVYPLDWAVWRARVEKGEGMGSVKVQMYTVAELKGGKEDYYPNGAALISCSRSIYPQGGNIACWWAKRHPEILQRY